MLHITSLNNQQVKDWKKLSLKKERVKQQAYLVEGFHLVEEALEYKKDKVKQVIIREDLLEDENFLRLEIEEERLVIITINIADEMSQTETTQGIFAELEIEPLNFPSSINGPILLLDAVQDPGNVGTMVRTADAAGFQGVFFGKGTVDLYNPKTLRGAQGSHFHLETYEGDLKDFILQFREEGYPVFGTALNEDAVSYKEVFVDEPFALVVGNEGAGINEAIIHELDQNIFIPMHGQSESLNVAVAAGILMFHLTN
ncbi:MAG TPA: RNA methyltransferase [Atopostipes sp.]|nr:RNA methyltransferase [Atopostipes sp.]